MSESPVRRGRVELGPDAEIGPWVLLGEGARDDADAVPLVIGARARIRSHSVIYTANRIGDDFQTGHGVLVREENRIGHRVSIGSHSVVEHHVTLADGVRLHTNVFVPEFSVLEEGCWLGPGVILTNARYPTSANAKRALQGPRIGARARLGAGVMVLPGVTIGADALVGAGAVVTKDVPPGTVVAGNPARPLRPLSEIPEYQNP
ncbi:MAG: hypothetical protein IT357_12730 [Gemmatimonadaceae bacterium]|nr:hypothetical protein [Gemmatimonadaceae bacterium]